MSNEPLLSSSSSSIAVVTGASSGIGYELTKQLVTKLNYTVYAAARRTGPIETLRDELAEGAKDKVIPVKLDVSDLQSILDFKNQLNKELPGGQKKIDLLYNNAGQSCTFPALDVTNESLEQVFKVNVFGPINLTRELSEFVINARGTIAFTGSLAGVCPFPFASCYSATKAAIHQYAHVLHLEMKPFGVRVLNVITGGVDTTIGDTRPLPPNSIYNFKQGIEAFKYRQEMSIQNKPMQPSVYVENVIKVLGDERKDPIDTYQGSKAWLMGWVYYLAPKWIFEWGLIIHFKLKPVFDVLSRRNGKEKCFKHN
ncbi:acylglycerone-phosphate reductase SCDLUD_002803 [Saccharomycodes ludwigii]|uniref:acylglycerone-phosphate reductase n=1 Tax=Saccharomycodes ludwigii TaxID=36035 RepID=UPI001E893CE3|nr:hypothetical protein SCDLUD_002803 [Saccharomycodes ludwigii]KAH3901312.1 hypothetical protein SCDLUD_002803 [Saccharomycodes ludwigii]